MNLMTMFEFSIRPSFHAADAWQQIKPAYVGDDTIFTVQGMHDASYSPINYPNRSFIVGPDVPDNANEGIEDGCLVVTGDDLKGVFDGVVDQVLILLTEQIDGVGEIPAGKQLPILLVGGFGSSVYLKKRIQETFGQCDVLQPPDA
jgi:hypothetical protein